MAFQVEETLAALSIGDYFMGRGGVVWKVVKKREDGYLGVANAAGEKLIVKPEHADRRVQQVIYGADSMEEWEAKVQANLKESLGAVVLHTEVDGKVTMPTWDALYSDADQLRAHLRIHHDARLQAGLEIDDLTDLHGDLHSLGADDHHTHPED